MGKTRLLWCSEVLPVKSHFYRPGYWNLNDHMGISQEKETFRYNTHKPGKGCCLEIRDALHILLPQCISSIPFLSHAIVLLLGGFYITVIVYSETSSHKVLQLLKVNKWHNRILNLKWHFCVRALIAFAFKSWEVFIRKIKCDTPSVANCFSMALLKCVLIW